MKTMKSYKYKLTIIVIILSIILLGPLATFAKNLSLINQKAPNFDLTGYNPINKEKINWNLNDFNKSWLVLYFYPKDGTYGCTLEARGFQKLISDFNKVNTKVVGISNDTLSSHEKFCNDEEIDFSLLSDKDGVVSRKYKSWNGENSIRNTYLINPDGFIKYQWLEVIPSRHPKEVLRIVEKFNIN